MILVVGASGSLGRRIVRGLLERGEAVRALVRSEAARELFDREKGTPRGRRLAGPGQPGPSL